MDEIETRVAGARNTAGQTHPRFCSAKGSPEMAEKSAKRVVTRKKTAAAIQAARSAETVKATERAAEGWTAKKRIAFLAELAETGNAKQAGRTVGLNAQGAYAVRRRDAEFAGLWAHAIEQYADAAEARATEMALNGVTEEVIHKGEVRISKRYSDRLLSDVLNRRRPAAAAAVKAAAASARLPGVAGEQGRLILEARLAALEAKKAEIEAKKAEAQAGEIAAAPAEVAR